MSDRTPGGLVLVDDEARQMLTQPTVRPPFAKPAPVPSFSTGRRVNVPLASDYFITDAEAWLVELDSPALLFTSAHITNHAPLIPVLEECAQAGRAIVIGAPIVDTDALVFLINNKLRGVLCCAAFETDTHTLDDLARFAGGSGALAQVESHKLADLPRANRLVLSPTALSIRP